MEEKYQLSNTVDFIEGESEARDLIYTLADEITSAVIPQMDGTTVPSKWTEITRNEGAIYVEYETVKTQTTAKINVEGKLYDVYTLTLSSIAASVVTSDFKFNELNDSNGKPTGNSRSISFDIEYVDLRGDTKTINTATNIEALYTRIPNEDSVYGYDLYIVSQGYYDENNVFYYDSEWDHFEIIHKIENPDFLWWLNGSYPVKANYSVGYFTSNTSISFKDIFQNYKFNKVSYKAKPNLHVPRMVVLKATPDVPDGIMARDYFVKFSQRMDDFNYFDVNYGVGFELVSEPIGDPADTYRDLCDPLTVMKEGETATIYDQLKVHLYMLRTSTEGPPYVPPVHKWELDITNTKEMESPTSHFFTGRSSTTPWVVDKIRRPDFLVRYWLSVNNNRIAMVVEGDPAPSINDYYRSFGYIGKITPFNKYDHAGNFGVTVGMGHLEKDQTNFVEADIKEDTYDYGKWGEYTSNGMWSMSMFNTRSNVFFQAHHPAFLTQLPDYNAAGTLPPALKRLVLDDDRFQTSIWTSKYHGSPIYLVHRSEGYRGFMDGAVVIEDHNIVNGDELVVDTHILKNESDPSEGTWTEVYKFFSLNTPVNLFNKYSPAPSMVSVAILKEIY